MSFDLVLVGCGEHATVIVDAALSRERTYHIHGYTDVQPNDIAAMRAGIPFLGTDEAFLERFVTRADLRFVLGVAGIGIAPLRAKLARMYEAKGAVFARVLHSTAWISPTARIEDGAVVMAGAVVNSGARIGRHAIVNTGAIVEHDVEVGAFASVAPGAVIGGGAVIGEGSYVGLGARVRDHIKIGQRTMIGMGAAVVGDVDDDLVVVGVPAKPVVAKAER